jgi:alpha/beta superfamily hydrolase
MKGIKLGEVENLRDIKLGATQIAQQPVSIGIIHGTADDVMPLNNSEQIIAASNGGILKIIEGADHSFRGHEYETELLAVTHSLLQ